MNSDHSILIHYHLTVSGDPLCVLEKLCHEQSTAQWARVGINEDLRPQFGAKVVSYKILTQSHNQTELNAIIAHPYANFGARLPNLLSAIAGEGAFYVPQVLQLRIEDVEFPTSYLNLFTGPRYGIEGLRNQWNIHHRPFFIGVVKPNIGLKPDDFADLAIEAFCGGLDIAKDDEMLADIDYSPLAKRLQAIQNKKQKLSTELKSPSLYLANVTDEVSQIPTLCKQAEQNGANAVMLNSHMTGLSSLRLACESTNLPLFGHFTGLALFDRIPHHGISAPLLIKLQRLAGCDAIIMPGFGERMHMDEATVKKCIAACLEPMANIKPSLPVPGGSDSAITLPQVFQKVGHINFGFICGRGIFAHPQGPRAGAQSVMASWDAITKGMTLDDQATYSTPLKQALQFFKK